MKKLLSIFLICCTPFVFAEDDDSPVFEETDEQITISASYSGFTAEEPIFEEDNEQKRQACGKEGCDEDHAKTLFNTQTQLLRTHKNRPYCDPKQRRSSYVSWQRYKANFGMEKVFVRFPQKPAISQSHTLLTAYAYDYGVLYSLAGYFPPVGNINSILWFDEILNSVNNYPYALISHCIFQASNGDWVMDYVAHDFVQNLILKGRAIVTLFNGYTLQCVKPNGTRDYFDYFIDNFSLRYQCD